MSRTHRLDDTDIAIIHEDASVIRFNGVLSAALLVIGAICVSAIQRGRGGTSMYIILGGCAAHYGYALGAILLKAHTIIGRTSRT